MCGSAGLIKERKLGSYGYWLGFPVALLILLMCCNSVYAFNIPTGSEDWILRWDNTFRYTLSSRVASREDALLRDPNADDANRNFKNGIISNRVDFLSEMDLVYQRSYGLRASGAFWYDNAYSGDFDNDSLVTSNTIKNGSQVFGLTNRAERYFEGPSGELLDLFVFGKLNAGGVANYFKVGRHTYYWGEGLLNPIHATSYAQMPLDLAKAQSQPGVEVKEVFRPRNSISVVSQISPEIGVAAQYFLEWDRALAPEAGTYFSTSDLSLKGSGSLILAPEVIFLHGEDSEPEDRGDFGVALKWQPTFTNANIGFYYRKFSDILPQAIINLGGGTYHYAFGDDIDLLGLSYSTTVHGISLGVDLNYRRNMPLLSEAIIIPDSSFLPNDGDTLGARGETVHAVINFLNILKETSLWDAGSWNIEFGYSRWLEVDEGKEYFKGRSAYHGFDRVTRDNGVVAANFAPQWMQVYPGLDVTLPLTASYGLWGVSAVTGGGAKKDGSFGCGIEFAYLVNYKVKFNYVNYFGEIDRDPATGIPTARGSNALLRDRDFVSLTFKTSF